MSWALPFKTPGDSVDNISLFLALDYTFTYHRIDLAPSQKTCLNFERLATKGKEWYARRCWRIKMNIWRIINLNCGERYEVMINHRSPHNLRSCEIRPGRDSNPWPLRNRCSALPTVCITAMINHVFISFSPVQIYDLHIFFLMFFTWFHRIYSQIPISFNSRFGFLRRYNCCKICTRCLPGSLRIFWHRWNGSKCTATK